METAWTTGRLLRGLARFLGAGAAALGLVLFLALTRILDEGRHPDRLIRTVDMIEEVALPAPPPPPPSEEEPPPPPPPALPRLDLQLSDVAPPLKAVIDRTLDFTMVSADFAFEMDTPAVAVPAMRPAPVANPAPAPRLSASVPKPVVKSSYGVGELDAKPQLLNSPSVTYPSSLLRQGIKEGRAVVEIAINPSGSVTVRSLISCSHPEFAAMARSFASRARFSIPRKNGQPVTAIYRWQLILRP